MTKLSGKNLLLVNLMDNKQKIKNIIFDVGGVLIMWDPNIIYKRYFANDFAKIEKFYKETGIWQVNSEMDCGRPFQDALTELAQNFPHYQEPILLWQKEWLDMVVGPIESSIKILKSLYTQGYSLYALTNFSAETFFTYMRHHYYFFDYFKDIVVSGVERVIKPNPQIYKILLQRNGLQPEECLFIDDVSENLFAAKNLGIATINFVSPAKLESSLLEYGIPVTYKTALLD